MKINIIRRIIALAIITTTLLITLPIGVSASWKQDSKGWWNTEGTSYSVGWRNIDGNWYYFDNNGYMTHNTIIDEYYIDSNGISVAITNGDIPIKIPSNWIKLDDQKSDVYVIDNKSAFVYDTTDTFGCSERDFINGMKYGLTKGSLELQVNEKNYNGKNATCLQYTLTINSETKKVYNVIFFKNNKAYSFNLASNFDDFDNAKQQVEDMLNLSLVL